MYNAVRVQVLWVQALQSPPTGRMNGLQHRFRRKHGTVDWGPHLVDEEGAAAVDEEAEGSYGH
eukprot:scaffold6691_cov358-Prasinococcus_capsulatus_cf.AAC.8